MEPFIEGRGLRMEPEEVLLRAWLCISSKQSR